jgi:methylglutaconyl-CoA hydratase
MSSEVVLYSVRQHTAWITLNRPERRNALSRELIRQLQVACERAEKDDTVRCLVITGAGNAFCAGMDLEELRQSLTADAAVVWEDARHLAQVYDYLYQFPKPTIAAVNGPAVAGGAGLVSVCDLAVAAPSALFGYPEVRRGLVAAMVMPHLLRHVGERTARWLLLTGELLDAQHACRLGLINAVVASPDDLIPTVELWCGYLLQGGPQALAQTKALLVRATPHNLPIEELARNSAEPRLGQECRQGLEAFFEKRQPPWVVGLSNSNT